MIALTIADVAVYDYHLLSIPGANLTRHHGRAIGGVLRGAG